MIVEQIIESLSKRFNGVDLQWRSMGAHWAPGWRLRVLPNKNEASEYRLTVYGPTVDRVVAMLHVKLLELTESEREKFMKEHW